MEIWRDTTITLNELPLSLARIMPRRWWLLEKEVQFVRLFEERERALDDVILCPASLWRNDS